MCERRYKRWRGERNKQIKEKQIRAEDDVSPVCVIEFSSGKQEMKKRSRKKKNAPHVKRLPWFNLMGMNALQCPLYLREQYLRGFL